MQGFLTGYRNIFTPPAFSRRAVLGVTAACFLGISAACAETKDENTAMAPLKPGMAGNYLASQFARNTGDIDKGIRYLRRAYHASPKNMTLYNQLQGMLLFNGNVEEAAQLAKTVPDTDRAQSLTALLLCLDAVKQNDLPRAHKALENVSDTEAGQLWLPLMMAWLDVADHKLTKPANLETIGVETGQAAALTHYHLALINAQAGFKDAAIDHFRKAVSDGKNPPLRLMQMLAKFYERSGTPQELTPLVLEWTKHNPDGQLLTEDIPTVFTAKDGIAEVLFTMGSVMQSAGAPHEAIIYLQLARYLKPEFALAVLSLGDVYTELEYYEAANEIYLAVNDKSQFYFRSRLRLAMNEKQMGRTDSALAYLDALADKLPSEYEALVAKGDFLRAQKKFDKAIDAYTKALQRIAKPNEVHWPILFSRGVSYDRTGQWQLAVADLKKALELKPNQPDVMNYLGYSWLMQGAHLEEAREMIERAIAMRPNDPQIADSMGWALYSLAKYNEALPYLERALELLPSDPIINEHLGDLYWRLGRKNEARFQWERSLTYSPAPQDAKNIQKKLEEGLAATQTPSKPPQVAESMWPDITIP